MDRFVAGEMKAREGIPIMAAFTHRIGIDSNIQGEASINDAQMCDIARIKKQDGIPGRLVVWIEIIFAVQLILVRIKKGRVFVFFYEMRDDLDAIGIDIIIRIKRNQGCSVLAK
jgi:hypothetical protein